ncbi:hypothetical protein C8R42DRAFT_679249 [Lentinula raphanica]|nr:hypothetical protein C8R42DRAFT_679249 [Lentinula raphanica]
MRFVLVHWKNLPSDGNLSTAKYQRRNNDSVIASASRSPASASFDNSTGLSNPRLNDPPEIWYEYLKTHSRSWPNGVRKHPNGDPCMSDLRASRIFAQLRPILERGQLQVRNRFIETVLSLFTKRGYYQALVEQLGLQISSVARLIPFIFSGVESPISVEVVARHFASCGVTVKEAEDDFAGWAIQYELEREVNSRSRRGL